MAHAASVDRPAGSRGGRTAVEQRVEDVERQQPTRSKVAPDGGEAALLLGWLEQDLEAPEADDHQAELHRQVEVAHVAGHEPDPRGHLSRLRGQVRAAGGLHAGRQVEVDDIEAGAGQRDRDAAGAATQVEHRPADLSREGQVELDVALEDALTDLVGDPRVVDLRVEARSLVERGHPTLRIIHLGHAGTTVKPSLAKSRSSVKAVSMNRERMKAKLTRSTNDIDRDGLGEQVHHRTSMHRRVNCCTDERKDDLVEGTHGGYTEPPMGQGDGFDHGVAVGNKDDGHGSADGTHR